MTSHDIELPSPPSFRNIPQMTQYSGYSSHVGWSFLEEHIRLQGPTLNLDPDFQRAHVWTEEKQIQYVEHRLRGGHGAIDLWFNCPAYAYGRLDDYVLVDGKQRLEAVRKFMRSELTVFGKHRFQDFVDRPDRLHMHNFVWHVNTLATRAEVLQWYLDLNTGGVVHTAQEIHRVRRLLTEELQRQGRDQ